MHPTIQRRARAAGLTALLFLLHSFACGANLSISNVPLGTGAGVSVKPNLVLVLDDSGSMGWDFLPDYVTDSICWGSGGSTTSCSLGDPPFTSSGFNLIWYNPAVRYSPPVNADGTSWSNASKTTPRNNGFDSSSGNANLAFNSDIAWCKPNTNPTGVPATDTNCKYHMDGTGFTYPLYPSGVYTNRVSYNAPNPYYYNMVGTPQWCADSTYAQCAAKRSSSLTFPRFSAVAPVTGVQASRSFYITKAGGGNGNSTATLASICANDDSSSSSCNGTNILTSSIAIRGQDNSSNRNALANAIVSKVGGGYVAQLIQSEGSSCPLVVSTCALVKITAPGGTTSATNSTYNGVYVNVINATNISTSNGSGSGNVGTLSGGVDYVQSSSGVTFTRVDIKSGREYPKAAGRTDCTGSAGTTCTYDQELQNYANWYSYYRTRLAMAKTSISQAFSSITDSSPGAGFRVGLMTISAGSSNTNSCVVSNRALEVPIGDFNTSKKSTFYTNLFAITDCSNTPLRGALSRAGRLYAGKLNYDPVQFSCQQNFAFMATDGYWNTGLEGSSFGPKDINGSNVGDQDGGSTSRPQLDASSVANTLADVAMYYYKTDLRPSMTDDVPKSSKDNVSHQHMVTFTMGLGIDGTLSYSPNYETGGSADYTGIIQGTLNWPDPIANAAEERIDDLWHAAVNGRGKYFSAKSPGQVSSALTEALQGVSAMSGSAAAAATSNLEPVAGDNFAYVASYVTQTWEGNIEAKTIDLTTGALSSTSSWTAQSLLDTQAALATVPTGASGPGGRVLYTYKGALSGTDKKVLLNWANVQSSLGWDGSVAGIDYFNPTQLPQCSPIANCPGATRQNLFEYLAGGRDTTSNGSYRPRVHVLGDIVDSQPVYVKAPNFSYTDSGYTTYKSGSNRKAMVYVGGNDGFLHAFDAASGNEDWAYLPAAVASQWYGLASTSYPHRYYVDGTITVGDIKDGSTWRTILVGGLNSGGKAYYALDVTDPAAPVALWEFTDPRMGYSYGNPVVTKLPTGTKSSSNVDIGGKWVAIVTSGYNNASGSAAAHDGHGAIFVLDAYSGTEYFRIYTCTDQATVATCAGSNSSPNGLARINNWVADPLRDNTTLYVYGGDLEGGLWRFDLKNKSAFKVAAVSEPITVKPELALIYGERAVYFGTGLFLQASDKSDHGARTIFAIKDSATATGPLTNVKTSGDLVEQTLSVVSSNSSQRTVATPQPVDWGTGHGWFVRLPESGERVNVDPKIQLGTLVVASNVPDDTSAASCTTGGHAWLNFLDIYSGSYVVNSQSNASAVASSRIGNALAVGLNVVRLPNAKLMAITTTSDNQHPVTEVAVGSASLPTRRVSWRELRTD